MINATLRKLKYSELYERLFDQESDKESPTSLYNILLLAAIIGCMAIDTSICERGFSLMNMLKTAKRSRMGIPLLRMLMKPARSARCGRIRARSPQAILWISGASRRAAAALPTHTSGERRRCWTRAHRWRPRRRSPREHRDVSYTCQLHVSKLFRAWILGSESDPKCCRM